VGETREGRTFSGSLIVGKSRGRSLIFPPTPALLAVVDLDTHAVVGTWSTSFPPRDAREVGLDERASVLDGAELGESESLRDAGRAVHDDGRRVDGSAHVLEEVTKGHIVDPLRKTKKDDGC
jgi:hypothetical protein